MLLLVASILTAIYTCLLVSLSISRVFRWMVSDSTLNRGGVPRSAFWRTRSRTLQSSLLVSISSCHDRTQLRRCGGGSSPKWKKLYSGRFQFKNADELEVFTSSSRTLSRPTHPATPQPCSYQSMSTALPKWRLNSPLMQNYIAGVVLALTPGIFTALGGRFCFAAPPRYPQQSTYQPSEVVEGARPPLTWLPL